MDALIYSLNATVPIFVIILIGFYLRRKGVINEGFISSANKINFKLALPCMLVIDMMNIDLEADLDPKYILFCAIVTTISFWTIWGLAKIFIKDKKIIGAFVQGSFRSSAAVLGTALIVNIYGNSSMAPFMMIGSVPLYNIFSVIVLTFEADTKQEKTIGKAIKGIFTNPIILSIALGLILARLHVTFPVMLDSTISTIGRMTTPLALLAIGAGFSTSEAVKKFKPALVASMLKLVIIPLVFLPMAIKLGYRNEELIAILIMLGAPTTPSCYIMAKNMDNDADLTTSIVVLTTAFSAFTITAMLFVLRYYGYVAAA